MAKILATEIRNGILIELEKSLWRVTQARHVHVGGRGGAYMQVEAKDVQSGSKNSFRLRTDEKVERPFVEQRKMRYLYPDGNDYVFMDEDSFDQTTLSAELLDEREGYLLPDTIVTMNLHNDTIIGVEFPSSVVLTITQTEPQARGATASSSYKPATVETGLTIMVPPFITTGEKIRVSVESGEYQERAD